jgi:hypothetical protein
MDIRNGIKQQVSPGGVYSLEEVSTYGLLSRIPQEANASGKARGYADVGTVV